MEVHHHTHHPKKWKEYITEFLMLFLAVTLGFLAENIREHATETKNTNKSLVTLYKDIQADSITVSNALNTRNVTIEADSIMMKFYKSGQIKNKINQLYLFDFLLAIRAYPKINRMALDELNSNGKLNFIENEELKKNIQNYFQYTKDMESRRTREHEFLDKHHDPIRIKHFDIYDLNFTNNIKIESIKIENNEIACDVPIRDLNFKLINGDKFDIVEYLNTANYIVSLESADNSYYIIPFQKDIATILNNLRAYFKENKIQYN